MNPNFPILAPKITKVAFYCKVTFLKIAQKVSNYLGHFNQKIWCQELSKIVQSGHTADDDDIAALKRLKNARTKNCRIAK